MGDLPTMDRRYRIICEKLIQAREEAGYTQAEAAHLLKRHQWFVSRSETGSRRVDIIELSDFARIYGKTLHYFLENILE